MKNTLLHQAAKFKLQNRKHKRWQRAVSILACIVVFCTVYALILPALTAEGTPHCGIEEHTHTDECYENRLICGKEEGEGAHTHTDECYTQEQTLICGLEEGEGAHTHTEECYDEEGNLICGLEENEGHQHTEECYQTEDILTCDQEESEGHQHTAECYEQVLACGKEEHAHSLACYSDPNADVEDADTWQNSVSSVSLTGNWGSDLAAIAQTQIGYRESTSNYNVAEDGATMNGYTRYGAWAGDPYRDNWSAQFTDFCLSYAGIPSSAMVQPSDCWEWASVSKEGYTPNTGDLIILDGNQDGTPDHAGIVLNANDAQVTTVIGDSDKEVKQNTYNLDNAIIVGYVTMPRNPNFDYGDAEPAADDADAQESDNNNIEETPTAEPEETPEPAQAAEEDEDDAPEALDDETSSMAATGEDGDAAVTANEPIDGLDITSYVDEMKLSKLIGAFWEPSNEFTTDDQVKAHITFSDIPKSTIQANNNTGIIRLPEGFDCSAFRGNTYKTYDGKTVSGEYTFKQDSNGCWYIELRLDKDYVDKAGDTIGGGVELEFKWDKDQGSIEGQEKTITIGNWTGTVIIKKTKDDSSDENGSNYKLSKDASKLEYGEDGNTGYITYTVTLTVEKDLQGPLVLTDNLTGKDWSYVKNSITISPPNSKINWIENQPGDNENKKKSTITMGEAGEVIKAGTYTITYKVENGNLGKADVSADEWVSNEISGSDEGKKVSSSKTVNTVTSIINKQGELVSGDGNTYIDYTVYLNAGDIVKNLTEGAQFKDTLPPELGLVGDVIVKQYDVKGNEKSHTVATVNGQEISYTTPIGQYYYVITYRTIVKDSANIPIGGADIKNEGTTTGGLNGDSTATVTVPNHVLDKKFKEQHISQNSDGKWINTIKWKSQINVNGSLKDYTYEDWSSLAYNGSDNKWKSAMYMTEDQRNAIKILDGNGVEIKQGFTIESSKHIDSSQNVLNGLYKITFNSDDVQGPVTIQYETTVDLSMYNVNDWIHFTNCASVTKDGHVDNAEATTDNIQYEHDNKKVIHKYGASYVREGSGTITLNPGETTIPWTIVVNDGQSMTGDLTITDTIAEGMELMEDSLDVKIWSSSIKDQITYTYDKNTKVLQIEIKGDVYKNKNTGVSAVSFPITISYRTKLPDDFFSGSDTTKKFTNTASVSQNGTKTDSSFNQTVTRKVVGKSGKYDEKNQELTYEIILNQDGSKLNNGRLLTVLDRLDTKDLGDNVVLENLMLFTALKSTDSNGNIKIEPGTFVRELVNSTSKEEYTYIWNQTDKQFTAYVPDGTAYVIVAKYYVTKEPGAQISLSNSVEIQGQSKWDASDSNTKVNKDTSGHTYTGLDSVAIVKHDKAQYNTLLNGAEFKLEQYDNDKGNWVAAKSTATTTVKTTLTTSGDDKDKGKDYTPVLRNVLYRLVETKAPDKYVIDETPYYFIVTAGKMGKLPESVTDDDYYSKDKVKTYTIESGNDKFANIVIDRYNAKDTTIVEPRQLRVNKEWVDGSGNIITDSTKLNSMPDVIVTLTKHKLPGNPKVVVKEGVWNNAHEVTINDVKPGGYIVYQLQPYEKLNFDCDDKTVQCIDVGENCFEIGPISKDCIITSDILAWKEHTTKGGSSITTPVTTEIGKVTLNASNQWSYVWKDLETGDGITYTLVEEAVDGYKTTYTVDSNTLTEGQEFSIGANGSKVTVTNTADKVYELPETGGIGTNRFTAVGLALMAGSLMCGYVMRRKRRERREI